MADEESFAAWIAQRPHHKPFRECVRLAAENLALGRGDLRTRLVRRSLLLMLL